MVPDSSQTQNIDHNIKKENIGLIEVMGLAVLPARLKEEIADMKKAILSGEDFANIESIEKHKAWYLAFADNYEFNEENTEDIIKTEIGKTFVRVLKDAGVFKDTAEGRRYFDRFVAYRLLCRCVLHREPRRVRGQTR